MRKTTLWPLPCRIVTWRRYRLPAGLSNHLSISRSAGCGLCLLSAVSLLFTGCNPSHSPDTAQQPAPAKAAEPIKANIIAAKIQSWPTIVRCQGSLMADDQTVLGSRVAGLVLETMVDIGDQVEPGQTLVTLNDNEFQLQLAAAEAAVLQARALIGLKPGDPISKLDPNNAPPVREARAVLEETRGRRERWEGLRSQNAVTEEELQTLISAERVAEARFASALNGVNSNIAQVAVRSAEVDLIKQRIQDAVITSPFAGSVQQRLVAAGTFVQIGSPIVSVVRLDALRFRGSVPERQAIALKVGQSIRLSIESIENPIDAKVTRISPALDMSSRSLSFEALIDNSAGHLRAGLFAEAEVIIDPTAESVVVDESALVEFAGTQKIWKVVDGKAQEQLVRPGRRSNRMVEILEGLQPGEMILSNGAIGRVAQVVPTDAANKASPTALTTAPDAQTNDAPNVTPQQAAIPKEKPPQADAASENQNAG